MRLLRCYGDGHSLQESERHERRKMTQGKEKSKTTIRNDEQENEEMNGHAEQPQTAEERDTIKLPSRSDTLKVNSEDAEEQTHLRPDSDEQQGDDDIYELTTPFNLIIQRHEGETCEGQIDGEGVALFEGGHMYKGMFSNGLMDGRGVFTRVGGLKYEGEFVRNMPMGQGTFTWPDGSSYKGEVYKGIRHGTGTYKCADGVSYSGQWDQGKRHGKGAVYYNQDKTSWYKGDWVKNNREGWGVRCYPSGNIYFGEWKNNLRHGEGTMRWLKLGQQYVGMWQNGVQHGRGTHVWILKGADESHYSQCNKYTGDFAQGQWHGRGAFYYASGAIYEGEWRNNKRHGQGKFTFKDGHVFDGEFVDNQTMTLNLNGNRDPTSLCGTFSLSDSDSSILGPDMALNIGCLLDKLPERERDAERKQVEFVVLMQVAELRSVYSFYSRLGHAHSPDNVFMLTRLQLWRLLKDCYVHHHDITLTQIDRLIRDATTAEIHSPFTPMLFQRLLSCLVVVAYHIYHKDIVWEKNLLATCFSKLMTDNILPNAKNVKGFLFRQPDCAVVAMNYIKKCWEVYQAYCRVNASTEDDQTMTCKQLLWMFKDLHLLDNNLTTATLLEIITAETHVLSNLSSCLDQEITFLEFFEVLLGSAEVKYQVSESQSLSSPDTHARRDVPELEASENILQTTSSPSQSLAAPVNSPITPEISSPKSVETVKSGDAAESSTAQDVDSEKDVKTKVSETPQSAEHTEEHGRKGKDVKTRVIEATYHDQELWIQMIHQFFNIFSFPAFEHNQSVSRYMKKEKLRQETQRHIA
ncbi:radial spoke head 10 homolog B isoform X2 [Larimichthys crocea]|uniref:radial spoke head 10 homolog B isoform X2 n=1 Tax=Larimichthys crocea TaxID=215358 RepID=UPI000F5F0CDC|nr:radial spoke head 10 homolog B isoform X2 [Larimichthys crocea]